MTENNIVNYPDEGGIPQFCTFIFDFYVQKLTYSQFLEYTGYPITMLILQNKPNFHPFQLKIEDLLKKQTQFKPNQSQTYTAWAIWAIFARHSVWRICPKLCFEDLSKNEKNLHLENYRAYNIADESDLD